MIQELEIKLGKFRQEKAGQEAARKKEAPARDVAKSKMDEAKARLEAALARGGKDSSKEERVFREAENSFWIVDSRLRGLDAEIERLATAIDSLEAEIRKTIRQNCATRAEELLRAAIPLQEKLFSIEKELRICVDVAEENSLTKLVDVRVDQVTVEILDPELRMKLAPKKQMFKTVLPKGEPSYEVESFVPNTEAPAFHIVQYTKAKEWEEKKWAKIVSEVNPKFEQRTITEKLPEIMSDVGSLDLGTPVTILGKLPESFQRMLKGDAYLRMDLFTASRALTDDERKMLTKKLTA